MVSGEGWKEKETKLDFVYQLLKNNKHPLHYSVLLEEICSNFPFAENDDPLKIKAMFYTWLNLDPRFNYTGKGLWGLRSWLFSAGQHSVSTLMQKPPEGNELRPRVSSWERWQGDLPEKTYFGQENMDSIDSDESFLGYDED